MMHLNQGNMRFLISLFLVLIFQLSFSQEKIKIDGISSVVGDFIILDSDIDKVLIDMESQGISTRGVSKCQLLGKLMEDKLYAHHAIQDSLELSDNEIYDYVDRQLEYFTEQLGGIEKVLEFYKKRDEISFRDELFEINKTQRLSEMMQESIVEKVEITPEEVRQFFQNIPVIDLPIFGTELEIAQIVIEPKVSEEENQRIIDQLKLFREDILEGGMSFASKALLYSQDPGSRSKGGKYTLNRKKPRMTKEFRDVAFSLREDEISQPFKTDFGWHILKVDKIRGQEIDIRHILLIPKISDDEMRSAKDEIDKLRERIADGEITFSDAALRFSDEKETRLNGGVLINPSTNDTRFELTKMDPLLYSQIKDLNDNQMSMPLLDNSDNSISKYKILKITNRFEEHKADFSTDYVKIKELALTDKQLKTIKKWMEEKIEETYVNVNSDSSYCDFVYNWIKE
jgi:peptidyl-prolyl cis-trans isomerase SurA